MKKLLLTTIVSILIAAITSISAYADTRDIPDSAPQFVDVEFVCVQNCAAQTWPGGADVVYQLASPLSLSTDQDVYYQFNFGYDYANPADGNACYFGGATVTIQSQSTTKTLCTAPGNNGDGLQQGYVHLYAGNAISEIVIQWQSNLCCNIDIAPQSLVLSGAFEPTSTPLPTSTATQTATNTPLPTNTNTPLPTETYTPLPSATDTPVSTETQTSVPPTATNTPLPTATTNPSAATPDVNVFIEMSGGEHFLLERAINYGDIAVVVSILFVAMILGLFVTYKFITDYLR